MGGKVLKVFFFKLLVSKFVALWSTFVASMISVMENFEILSVGFSGQFFCMLYF